MFQIDIEQISQMARKVAEQINGVRQKSKSIKKDNNSILSNSVKNSNSLQTTLNSTLASQYNNSLANNNNNSMNANAQNNNISNCLSISASTNASMSSIQKRVKFTQQEDEVILKYVQKHGKKWSEISKRLPGRTEVMVRNRYYVKIRKINKEKDNGDQSQLQNESEAGLFFAENSSFDANEQVSEQQINLQSLQQQSQQTNALLVAASTAATDKKDENDILRIDDESILYNSANNNSANYPLYFNNHFDHDNQIFDSPIKQGIFDDDIIPFHQNNINSLHQFDDHNSIQHHHHHHQHHHHYPHKNQQNNIFDSVMKDYPENHPQNAFSHQNLNINQENQFYSDDIHVSKAALLQNQQFIKLPYQNENQSSHIQQEDDDYFEEANKPFKLPKFDLNDEDFQDLSHLLPPIGEMDIHTTNLNISSFNNNNNTNITLNNNINNNNNVITPTSIDSAKQEKIQFLQNQISMIENMLNMCKDEIIREFAQRKSISTNADSLKTYNSNQSVSSPNHTNSFTNAKQDATIQLEESQDQQQQQQQFQQQEVQQQNIQISQEEAFARLHNRQEDEQMNESMEIEDAMHGSSKIRFMFDHDANNLNTNDDFNYNLQEQSQMITSLNNF